MYAVLITLIVWRLYPTLRPGSFFLIFVGSCVAFYFVWKWVFFDRRAELDEKVPIPAKELRKRRKQFFENLPR